MRPYSRPALVWIAAGLAAAWSGSSALAAAPDFQTSSYVYETPEGESFFAVGVRAKDLSEAAGPADRHVVLLDTSASQSGEYRQQSVAALQSLLQELSASSSVAVYALDVAAAPMTDGFVSPDSAREQVKAALAQRAPLGATNMAAGLKQALKTFGQEPTGSIIYIGDGMSASNLLKQGEMKSLVESLRSRHIPVHSFAVGPNTDWQLLGVLAHQTGGLVTRASADGSPAEAGARLAAAAIEPVIYPQAIRVSGNRELLIGETAPPLRTDRATLLVGRGELPESVRLSAPGKTTKIAVDPTRVVKDCPAVRTIALSAEQSGGLNMPAAGSSLLAAVDGILARRVETLAAAGRQAVENDNADGAHLALVSLIQADPAASEADRLDAAIDQAEAAASDQAPPAPSDGGLIAAEIERQRVLTEQLTIETNLAIAQARQLRDTSPAEALNLLKRQASQIRASVEIDPQARRELLRKLDNETVITANVQEKYESELLREQQTLAQLEAQERVIDRMILEEQKLEQLIAHVRALMYKGYHGDFEAFEEARYVAREAVNMRPGNGPALAALFTATSADQLSKANRLRALRSDRFLATLYQVELSAVPFPDEPPIVYPPPEVWAALTKRRKEYEAVSLDQPSAAEEKIREELDSPTRAEFPGIPLAQALQTLAGRHEINIMIDEAAIEEAGLSTDATVDMFLNGVTLRSALKLMLEQNELTYAIEDEVLKITTVDKAEEILSLRVYPVADLVMPIQQMGGRGGMMGGRGGMMGGRGGMMGGMGGMGGGMGGMGMGGMGMGGMGGGMGMFSVPAGNPLPTSEKEVRPDPLATPVEDPEMQKLLNGLIGNKTTHLESSEPIAFASIRDNLAARDGKKKE